MVSDVGVWSWEGLKRGKKNLCLNLKKKVCWRKVGNKIGQDTVIPDYGRP